MTLEKVIKMIAEEYDMDESALSAETSFEELGMDSLETVELVMRFEEAFGVTLELDESCKTIGDLAAKIDA